MDCYPVLATKRRAAIYVINNRNGSIFYSFIQCTHRFQFVCTVILCICIYIYIYIDSHILSKWNQAKNKTYVHMYKYCFIFLVRVSYLLTEIYVPMNNSSCGRTSPLLEKCGFEPTISLSLNYYLLIQSPYIYIYIY